MDPYGRVEKGNGESSKFGGREEILMILYVQ